MKNFYPQINFVQTETELTTRITSSSSVNKLLGKTCFLRTLISLLLCFYIGTSFGQSAGDYRSVNSGNWTDLSAWQRYDGTNWVTPTAAQGYPGQYAGTGAVTIQNGNNIVLNVVFASTQTFTSLTIVGLDSSNWSALTIDGTLGDSKNQLFLYLSQLTINNFGRIIWITNPAALIIPQAAVLTINGGELRGNASNGSQRLDLGDKNTIFATSATGNGPGTYTFDQINAVSTSLNALLSAPSPLCYGDNIVLTSAYSIQSNIGTTTPGGSTPGIAYSLLEGGTLLSSGTWPFANPLQTINAISVNALSGKAPGTYTYTLKIITYLGSAIFYNSKDITVIVRSSGTWLGVTNTDWFTASNWCGGVPTSSTDVYISTGVTYQPTIVYSSSFPDGAVCKSLTIHNGAKVTIAAGSSSTTPGGSLNVQNTITNNAGVDGLTIKSAANCPNGTLIFHNAPSAPVLATVEMYNKAYYDPAGPAGYKYKWQFFGIPLQGPVPPLPTCYGSYVRENDESQQTSSHTAVWTNASSLSSFRGYEITQTSPKTLYFQGQLTNSNYAYPITCSPSGAYPGNNILGNSYTAAINISTMGFGDNTEQAVYLYNTGSFADWQSNSGGTANGTNPGQYTVSTPGTAGTGGIPAEIPSMQGFMVKCTANSTFTFNYSWVKSNATVQRVKAFRTNEQPKIFTIIDVQGKRYGDRMWIFTDPLCSHTFNNGWDGRKFLGSSLTPQLYAVEPDGSYQIEAVDDINNTCLGFKPGEDASYTLTFTHTANTFDHYTQGIYLVDLVTDKVTNISQSGSQYTFTVSSSDPENRFKIITGKTSKMSASTVLPTTYSRSDINVFNNGRTIIINNNSSTSGQLSIYDMTGRLVEYIDFGAMEEKIVNTQLPFGVYIAKASTNTMKITKRLIIGK
ncbi:T9SS type A sorting domain-containing protein [Paludibacter jiangxiensis]|uniref:Por secretion system C-terminal sorting domain-containing protein n=1 Tax=Paludibacter jiangxiensis TaxID=681398 RepID=A0A161LFN7_9BACT|nr:T9SS type A sorting domain-containing protein [Paludibacter jiangxiensis]GAT63467.1 Por secretion system C-terminal sorting domain-containing protein [Paludibacter jiangxiensis]